MEPDTAHRLRQRARAWIAGDPDPDTRAELEALLEADDLEELRERVDGTLAFGTAGIRGAVGAGSLRMNRAVVIRTTRGLADHLRGSIHDLDGRVVVVGFDARHDSRRFAEDVVGVLAAAGIAVRWFPHPTPTPVVAFTAQRLGAAAAVVVTASHNPPQDNGYKVYADNGAQIVPPTDARSAAAIAAVGPASEVPRAPAPFEADGVEVLGDDAIEAYLDAVEAARPPVAGTVGDLAIVYTPLHGVGWWVLRRAFDRAGRGGAVTPVPEQVEPDGSFPTVSFPNPEEPGALDLAKATAERVDADVVLANDPDADRLAVLAREGEGWQALTGNQIGALLGAYLLERSDAARPLVISSIVSSPMLGDIAAASGARYETTLTGFKWIANAALDLEADGYTFLFGYEEALGYTIGTTVRDKDGISAAVVFADLVASSRSQGLTLLGALEDLYRRHGLWASVQHSIVRPGVEGQGEIAAAMRRVGERQPEALAGRKVVAVTDFRRGEGDRPRWLPASPLVSFELDDGGRALIRPSGTEPKLKIYVDLRADLAAGEDAGAREDALRDEGLGVARDLAAFVGLGDG